MKKNNFSKMFAVAAIAAASVSTGFAQTNIGADCGCPPFASRPVVNIDGFYLDGNSEFTAPFTVFDCSKTYRLIQKTYVPSGKTLTINPGTVVLGQDLNVGAPGGQAAALIIERGGKINAIGTATCPIVFTSDQDPMDGSYPIANRGKWGGIVVLGKATNNILATGNTLATGTAGVAWVEGYLAADTRIFHGAPVGTADDNDNSGILRYVSIRHAGDILGTGNELNGLTLGSVGSGTTIDHIEVVSCDDDAVELFGGTVNLKYISCLFGNDDMIDWDLGWSGKAQFIFGLKADEATAPGSDNGFEADADDQKTNALPRSHPYIYNATMIGNADLVIVGDNTGMAAIKAKELTEGEIYNSVFANWRNGLDLIKAFAAPRTQESWQNWINGSLKVNCNTFVNTIQNTLSINNTNAAVLASDITKFGVDNNVGVASLAGIDYTYTMNTTTNVVSNTYNAVPSSNVSTVCAPPVDGFFTPANYRGAFEAGKKSWLADWSYLNLVDATQGLLPCPTDINQDGTTNNVDFLQLLGQFNQGCN